jgi:phosphocarrier protein
MALDLHRRLTIANARGLHARASARFVETAERFQARALVSKDGLQVDGRSIMGLLTLAASQGSTIDVTTDGLEARELLDALTALVENRFGEDS